MKSVGSGAGAVKAETPQKKEATARLDSVPSRVCDTRKDLLSRRFPSQIRESGVYATRDGGVWPNDSFPWRDTYRESIVPCRESSAPRESSACSREPIPCRNILAPLREGHCCVRDSRVSKDVLLKDLYSRSGSYYGQLRSGCCVAQIRAPQRCSTPSYKYSVSHRDTPVPRCAANLTRSMSTSLPLDNVPDPSRGIVTQDEISLLSHVFSNMNTIRSSKPPTTEPPTELSPLPAPGEDRQASYVDSVLEPLRHQVRPVEILRGSRSARTANIIWGE